MPEPIRFRGIVIFQRYYNEDSFWGVFKVKTKERLPFSDEIDSPSFEDDPKNFEPYYIVTVAGKMQQLYVGSEYEFVANYEYNSRYKEHNYIPVTVTAIVPSSIEESRLFLESVLTLTQANVLLNEYPDIVQQIINGKDNVDISKLKGIGDKTYENIRNKIIDNYVISDIITMLQPYGITYNAIKNLLKWEPNSAILKQKIKDNPYVMTEARGFGFPTVDKMALKIQPELINSSKRLFAFIKYVLNKSAEEDGNTWIKFTDLYNSVIDQIPQCKDVFDQLVAQVEDGVFAGYFYLNNNRIGLLKYKECEDAIYNILKDAEFFKFNCEINTQRGIELAEKELGYTLSEDQKNVVDQINNNNVVIFAGAAGTGKSSTARAILNSFIGADIACCSLSAKAAQRIQEATGFEAKTIHRLLGYNGGSFVYTAKNKMPYDVIFIDEASMINCSLFYCIVSAIKEGAKLIICGDYAQLPPIGAGNVFSDLLNMDNLFNVSILSKVHRQAEKSGILTDANKIREGISPVEEFKPQIISGELKDMAYVFRNDRNRLQDIVVKQFLKITDKYGLDSVAITVPRKDTVVNSALEINKQIQLQLIDTSFTQGIKGVYNNFYVGDRIIQTENDSARDIYNGEVGYVEYVYPNAKKEEICMVAKFKSTIGNGYKIIEYNREQLASVLLGYALSVHKMQGSEYDYTIVVIDNTHYTLLDRCLLYTAITRAKKMCILIAEPEAFNKAMKNNFVNKRQTWLRLIYEEGAM